MNKIKNFGEFINEEIQTSLDAFGIVNEASLQRLWGKTQSEDFAIVSTFRKERPRKENLKLLRRVVIDLKNQPDHLPFCYI